jgi:hypothetical protein
LAKAIREVEVAESKLQPVSLEPIAARFLPARRSSLT